MSVFIQAGHECVYTGRARVCFTVCVYRQGMSVCIQAGHECVLQAGHECVYTGRA